MVVVKKMMKWSSSSKPMITTTESKKFQVKVKSIKLQGVDDDEEGMEKAVMVEMIWKGPKARLPPLHRISKSNDLSSKKMILMNNNGCCDVEWDEEFECVCSFTVKDGVFSPWEVSFRFLQGENGEPKNKFASLGTVSLNIAELASEMKGEVERKLPVVLQIVGGGGVSREVSLLITLSFIEVRVDSPETIQEANEPEKVEGFLKKLRRYGSRKKKKKVEIEQGQEPNDDRVPSSVSGDTDESTTFDSEGSPDSYDLGSNQQSQELVNNILEPENSLEIYYNNESNAVTQSESEQAVGFWRKRRLSFRSSSKRKDQQLIKIDGVAYSTQDSVHSTTKENERSLGTSESDIGSWEEKELISRDGHSKLKSNVFFASIDQRSEKASGESACTALVTIIADWLQSNKDTMPTRTQFDTLIMEGSSEWRKLCENEALIQHFPDKHFDLETVIEANLRPLSVVHNKSFVGFFCPERFESLKGAMSFDEIWNHLTSNVEEGESHTYIVSWNDHFFVMKVEAGMYYIIDTLGERLFEGCNQAYILKFDDQSEMYKLPDKSVKSSKEMDDGAEIQDKDQSCSSGEETEECEELVCKGKECCLEFLKRFLAAIPLRELEMEQKKGTISSIPLYQRLQIEVHYSSSSNSPSS